MQCLMLFDYTDNTAKLSARVRSTFTLKVGKTDKHKYYSALVYDWTSFFELASPVVH